MALSKCSPAWLPFQPQESHVACSPLGGCPHPRLTSPRAVRVSGGGQSRTCPVPRLHGEAAPGRHPFLTALPLPPPRETLDFPRSWLLPVIRDHVRETRLGFFTAYFLPLATTLKRKGTGPPQSWSLTGRVGKGSWSSAPALGRSAASLGRAGGQPVLERRHQRGPSRGQAPLPRGRQTGLFSHQRNN